MLQNATETQLTTVRHFAVYRIYSGTVAENAVGLNVVKSIDEKN